MWKQFERTADRKTVLVNLDNVTLIADGGQNGDFEDTAIIYFVNDEDGVRVNVDFDALSEELPG